MLGICLCNLATLELRCNKPFSALRFSIQAANIIEPILIKTTKAPDCETRQLAVVLTNSFSVAKVAIRRIYEIKKKSAFHNLYKEVIERGSYYALKYLGRGSPLSKRLIELNPIPPTVPVVYLTSGNIVHEIMEPKLIKSKMQQIMQGLAQMQFPKAPAPQVVSLKQSVVNIGRQILASISKGIGNGFVTVSIYKDAAFEEEESIKTANSDQSYGLKLDTQIAQKTSSIEVSPNQFTKITTQLNSEDILPLDLTVKSLSPSQNIESCFMPFLSFTALDLSLTARALRSPIKTKVKFLKQECLLFGCQIEGNEFRLNICPFGGCNTLRLNVQLALKKDKKTREWSSSLLALQAQCLGSKPSQTPVEPDLTKQIVQRLQAVLRSFEKTIIEEEQEDELTFTDFLWTIDNKYFEYTENQNSQGQFCIIEYQPTIEAFQVFLRNNFPTFGVEGKVFSKGVDLYQPHHLRKDFGLDPSCLKGRLLPLTSRLIARRYQLKTYRDLLKTYEQQIYTENAIAETQFVCSFHKTRCLQDCNGVILLTVQVFRIRDSDPIGLKVTRYDSCLIAEVGYYMTINRHFWIGRHCKIASKKGEEEIEAPKNESFLEEWLKREGATLVMDNLKMLQPDGKLQVLGKRRIFALQQFLEAI